MKKHFDSDGRIQVVSYSGHSSRIQTDLFPRSYFLRNVAPYLITRTSTNQCGYIWNTRSMQYRRCQTVNHGSNMGMYRIIHEYDLMPFPYPETNRVCPLRHVRNTFFHISTRVEGPPITHSWSTKAKRYRSVWNKSSRYGNTWCNWAISIYTM